MREQIRQARLLTLTGAGGSGKTRLALQAAAELIGTPGGVWLAELAPLTDGGQVAGTMAAVLGITDHGGSPATSAIVQALAYQDLSDRAGQLRASDRRRGEVLRRGHPALPEGQVPGHLARAAWHRR